MYNSNTPQRPKTPSKHEYKVTHKAGDGKWVTIGYADKKLNGTGQPYISVGIKRSNEAPWENFIIVKNEDQRPQQAGGPRQNPSTPQRQTYSPPQQKPVYTPPPFGEHVQQPPTPSRVVVEEYGAAEDDEGFGI